MPPWAISASISKRSTRSPFANVESEPSPTIAAPGRDLSARTPVSATRTQMTAASARGRWGGGRLGQLGAVAHQVALRRALRIEAQGAGVLGDVAAYVNRGRHVGELLVFQGAQIAFADLRALGDVVQLEPANLPHL